MSTDENYSIDLSEWYSDDNERYYYRLLKAKKMVIGKVFQHGMVKR